MNNKKSSTHLAVIVLDYFPKDCSECPCGRTYDSNHFCEAMQKWDAEGIDKYTGRPYFCPLKLQEVFTDELKYIMKIRRGGTTMTIKDLRKTKNVEFSELDGGASFEQDNFLYIKLYPDGLNDTDYNAYCISTGYMTTFYQNTMVKPVHLTILVENGDEEC